MGVKGLCWDYGRAGFTRSTGKCVIGWFGLTVLELQGYKTDVATNLLLMAATILIADDYEDNRELLRILLASAHYEVLEATNGQQCLAMARETPPDLLMIDLQMPIIDGWSLLKELKRDKRLAMIPCVAVTAYADPIGEQILAAGFNAYIAKPFRTKDVLDSVASLLAKPLADAPEPDRVAAEAGAD